MKFNWGVGLAVSVILFMIATLSFVFFALNQDFDLVEDDYYQKSVDYQQHINRTERTNDLVTPIQYRRENGKLIVELPDFFEGKQAEAELHFYRPDNDKLDTRYSITFSESLQQAVPLADFKSGKWQLKLAIDAQGVSYYDEYHFQIY